MSIYDFLPPPSLPFMLTYGITGLVCILINLRVFKKSRLNNLKVDLLFGALGLLLSTLLAVTPFIALSFKLHFNALASSVAGLLGIFMFVYGSICIYKDFRGKIPLFLRGLAFLIISDGLFILPWLSGAHTETIHAVEHHVERST